MENLARLLPHSDPGRGLTPLSLARRHGNAPLAHWGLPDKYEPYRVVGSGALGTVLLARDRSLGRLVAIKVLATDCPEFLARLRHEARLLARLEHPSIIRVHDLDVHDGRLYLAMEYAAGGNLALQRMEPVQLVRALRGVVDALGHAHANGIVHRDVKPENLLLGGALRHRGEAGPLRALLTDFGLACGSNEGSASMRRPIVGTPLTMSPEQVDGRQVGPASDVFSLGVTFYRQLTGRWPFRGRTVIDVFDAIRQREPDAFEAGCAPRRLESIVRKALAKDPGERFGSMDEFGNALDRFLRSQSLFSIPAQWLRSNRGQPRIHPEDVR